jgi:hypothetical protein
MLPDSRDITVLFFFKVPRLGLFVFFLIVDEGERGTLRQ